MDFSHRKLPHNNVRRQDYRKALRSILPRVSHGRISRNATCHSVLRNRKEIYLHLSIQRGKYHITEVGVGMITLNIEGSLDKFIRRHSSTSNADHRDVVDNLDAVEHNCEVALVERNITDALDGCLHFVCKLDHWEERTLTLGDLDNQDLKRRSAIDQHPFTHTPNAP